MENILDRRAANALFADAKLSSQATEKIEGILEEYGDVAQIGIAGASQSLKVAEFVLEKYAAMYGGLWVGGTATLTTTKLAFEPNAANRLVHENGHLLVLDLPLAAITSLSVKTRFVTDIIDIHCSTRIFSLRCFKAKAFAERIISAKS